MHTGQHYDDGLSSVFFDELELPRPDHYLGIGSGTNSDQTARGLAALEPKLRGIAPDLVLVYGDANPVLIGSLTAAQLGVPVAHVEAGLRSFDRSMPEELNRTLIGQIAALHFTTEECANRNLRREGIPADRVHLVGNVLIDSLVWAMPQAAESDVLDRLGLNERDYCLTTIHRPLNVHEAGRLREIIAGLAAVAGELPTVFPVHPRTQRRIEELGLESQAERLRLTEPLGYLDFVRLLSQAAVVLTDSGGVQEETTFLGTPCLTLRPNTERLVTMELGTNRLLEADRHAIQRALRTVLSRPPGGRTPPLWDGRAAERIARILDSDGPGPA